MSEDLTLPAIITPPSLVPQDVKVDDTLKQVQDVDLTVANDMLKLCYAGFSKVSSITSLTRLIDTTLKTVETRRKILCMEYGSPNQAGKSTVHTPLD